MANRSESEPAVSFELLSEIYKVMGALFGLTDVLRFQGTPYMSLAFSEGYRNPVGGHISECFQLWYLLRLAMPKLAEAVDSNRVYDLLVNHDNGELGNGDVTAYSQAQGVDSGKMGEKLVMEKLVKGLPNVFRDQILKDHQNFELPSDDDLEAQIARLVDSVSGNLVVLLRGDDLAPYSEIAAKILGLRFISKAARLIQTLEARDYFEAGDEVRALAEHHLQEYNIRGVDINPETLAKK